jgi:hypothetical protein
MRMTAPAIGIASIALAVALVWYFRPQSEANLVPEAAEAAASADAWPRPGASEPARDATAAAAVAPTDEPAEAAPGAARSPLPGETPATPMAQLLADRQQNLIVRDGTAAGGPPPELVEGEREFAAEPVDSTWAPGAEAGVLAKFAQVPGLELIDLQVECRSTMCRLQLTQPAGPAAQGAPTPFNILRDEIGLTPRWMMAIAPSPGSPTMKSIAYLWREGFAPEREAGAPHDAN